MNGERTVIGMPKYRNGTPPVVHEDTVLLDAM
jgi:hypothetical protein